MKRILLEINEGQIVRNLLENGLTRMLTAQDAEVLLVTPGASVPAFVSRYSHPGLTLHEALPDRPLTRVENYEFTLGRRLCRQGRHGARRRLWALWGERTAAKRAGAETVLLEAWKPDVVVSTHLSHIYGRGLVAAARRRGIPTVGSLMSWDNVWKGLKVRPDIVTCWSENNKDEICRMEGYAPEKVVVIGAPAFDAYMASEAQWTRRQFCDCLGLDPARKILLFATLGQFKQNIDETNPLEVLLHAIDAGKVPGRPQVLLRMHPWSRDVFFKRFMERPDVTVSRYENYVPGLTWCPTREEAILAGNLMRHADVVVSPGSTMCIEPAIFDTPTVVPVFNEYMPEVFEAYFQSTWLNQHFGRLLKNNWVPIVRSGEDMVMAINKSLCEPDWYQEGRRKIREEFLGPLDGQATERFAGLILQSPQGGQSERRHSSS